MQKLFVFFLGLFLTVSIGIYSIRLYSTNLSRDILLSPLSEYKSIDGAEASVPTPVPISFDLETVFSREPIEKYTDDVVMYATGDIIPARVTDSKIRQKGADYPFEKITSTLQESDFVVANLEAPLISHCPIHLDGMIFCGQPEFAGAMKRANISVAGLENNHITNFGIKGKEETKTHLSAFGIDSVIAGQPIIKKIKNVSFGFIAINGVGDSIKRDRVVLELTELRHQVDIVVVSVHWGKEYSYDPVRAAGIAPDDPQEIGHALIDAGADLVIGNHPHWVQGVEFYKDGFIAYAHGNFIFDQEWSQETKEGVIGSYHFRNKKLIGVSFIPLVIENYSQPRLAEGAEIIKILTQMKLSSERLLR